MLEKNLNFIYVNIARKDCCLQYNWLDSKAKEIKIKILPEFNNYYKIYK